jgi:hypothetical protein
VANRRVPKHQDLRSAGRSPSRSPSCNLVGEIRPPLTIGRDDLAKCRWQEPQIGKRSTSILSARVIP